VEITVNGERRAVLEGSTVASLLEELALSPARVAVERNGQVVRKADHAATRLVEGDRIEIVTFVGGG